MDHGNRIGYVNYAIGLLCQLFNLGQNSFNLLADLQEKRFRDGDGTVNSQLVIFRALYILF